MIKFTPQVTGYTVRNKHNCGICCDGKNQGRISSINIRADNLATLYKEIDMLPGVGELIGEPIPAIWQSGKFMAFPFEPVGV